MVENSDVLIVGAGTAGLYFGWLMAKKGFSVTIIEKDPRNKVGERLEVFHLDSNAFEKFGIPEPDKDAPELISIWDTAKGFSPDGKIFKNQHYGFHCMKLPPFLQRLFPLAEKDGVQFKFSTNFKEVLYKDDKIIGISAEENGVSKEFLASVVVDASGIPAVVRTSLPMSLGVENSKFRPEDGFYVVLRYIQWEKPDEPHYTGLNGWPFFKAFCNPCHIENGMILGIGQPTSFDESERVLKEFFEAIKFPPYKVIKSERGITPYRRPPYSFITNNFICLGDSAYITKPFSGEGITAAWTLCKIAADVLGDVLTQKKEPISQELWPINHQYFIDQGAKFAALLAQIPGAADMSAEAVNFLFEKDIIFNDEDITAVNTDFQIKLTFSKVLEIVWNMLVGICKKKISFKNLKHLMKYLSAADKLKKHYEKYPISYKEFGDWVIKAEKLWQNAD
jgi:flavin-dependent dehydrogenase